MSLVTPPSLYFTPRSSDCCTEDMSAPTINGGIGLLTPSFEGGNVAGSRATRSGCVVWAEPLVVIAAQIRKAQKPGSPIADGIFIDKSSKAARAPARCFNMLYASG